MAAPGYGSRQQMHGNRGNNYNNGRYDGNQGNFRNHGNGNDHFRNDGNRRNFTNNGDPFRNNSDPYRDNEGHQGNINDPFREDNNKEHYSNHENFVNNSDPYRSDGNQGNFHGNQTGNYGQGHDNRFVNSNEDHFNSQRENNFRGEDDFSHPKSRGGRVSPRLDKPEHRSYDELAGRDYNSRSPDRRQERRRGDYDRDYSSRRRRSRSRSRSRERNSSRSSRNRSRSRERRRERSPGYRHERDDSRDRRASRYERESRDNNRESEYRRSLASSSTSLSRDDRCHRDDHSRSGNVAGTTSSTSKFDLIQPSPTVIIQSLHLEAQEKDIEAILKEDGFVARNVSVIRERNSESRGFAFVDFDNENMARDWIIKRQQKLVILGQRSVLNYSRNKKQQQPNQQQQPTHVADWTCNKCNGLNFGSRHKFGEPFVCFKCNTIRDESDVQRQDQHQQNKDSSVCANPCNVLMIRGMDFSTEEEKIRMEVVKLTSKVLYDVRLIRDKITDMSRGFAFIELGTTEDAQELMEVIERMDPPFEIDGRRITVGYARNGYNAPLGGKKTSTGVVSKETAAQNALAQATAANPNSTPLEYSSHNVTGALQNPSSTGPTDGSSASTTALASQGFTYDAASGYYYDSNTGLYYDSSTGYYYNSTTEQWLQWDGTQYHVINQDGSLAGQPSQQKQQQQHATKQPPPPSTSNPAAAHQTQQQQQQHYTQQNQYSQQLQPQQLSKSISTPAQNALMIASDQHQKNQLQAGTPGQQASGESVQLGFQKPKSARKIAKDMERWAKKLNTQTETKKAAVKQAQQELRMLEQKEEELRKKIQIGSSLTESLATVSKVKDGVRSLFVPDNDEEGSVLKLGSALQSNDQKPRSSLVADYPDDDFDNDDDVIDESQFVDLSKMACLLCQRQLTSQENLTKHLTMSQLHKQNLEKYKRSKKNKR